MAVYSVRNAADLAGGDFGTGGVTAKPMSDYDTELSKIVAELNRAAPSQKAGPA